MVKNKMPEGWENYTAVGDKVAGSCFVPFKVPLKKAILQRSRVSGDEWFTPSILLQKVPNLKLVIDLTNTDRYYNIKEITENGVFHEKIKCPGGGALPSAQFLERFYNAVDNFITEHGNDYVIGVHCTHGLNRTGYFICKFMVTRMNILPEQAIKDFQMARGHTMNRPILINDILNIFTNTRELRVENYFDTLDISKFNFRNSNKSRFNANHKQANEWNSGNREIINRRIKSSEVAPKFFVSCHRNNPQTDREYEENRSSVRNRTFNFSWERRDGQGYDGSESIRRNVVGSSAEQQGRKRFSTENYSRYFRFKGQKQKNDGQKWSNNDITRTSAEFPKLNKSKRNKFKKSGQEIYLNSSLNNSSYLPNMINQEINISRSISNENLHLHEASTSDGRNNENSTKKEGRKINRDICSRADFKNKN